MNAKNFAAKIGNEIAQGHRGDIADFDFIQALNERSDHDTAEDEAYEINAELDLAEWEYALEAEEDAAYARYRESLSERW